MDIQTGERRSDGWTGGGWVELLSQRAQAAQEIGV